MVAQSNSPERPKIFLSYSRQELYFAEAVVQELSRHFDVWFDIQRLKPGLNWEKGIQQGKDECAALVLIASESSLQSPNVADEWEYVLFQRKIPVYILAFESVRFEPYTVPGSTRVIALDQLKAHATGIIDGRGRFSGTVKRLVNALQTRLATTAPPSTDALAAPIPNDPIPGPLTLTIGLPGREPLKLTIPRRVPLDVSVVAFALLFNMAMVLYLTVTLFRFNWPLRLAGVFLVLILGNQFLEFLARRFRYNQIRWTLLISSFGLAYLLIDFDVLPQLEVLLCFAGLLLMTFSKDLLRWAPRGQGPMLLRHGIRPFERFRQRFSTSPTGKKYVILANPADERIANRIRPVMNHAGFTEGWNVQGQSTDIRLCVLSNVSTSADLAGSADSPDQLVCVVASYLPDTQDYTALMNRQWVDFRNQNIATLRRMAEELRPEAEAAIVSQMSVDVTPQAFRLRIVPAPISLLNLLIFLIGASVAALLSGFLTATVRSSGGERIVYLVLFILLPLLVDLILIRYSNRLIGRDIAYGGCARLFILPIVLLFLVIVRSPFYILAIIPFWLIFLLFTALRSWLPRTHARPTQRSFFYFQRDFELWRQNLFLYGGIFLVMYGFVGNIPFLGTKTVPINQIQYARVALAPGFYAQIPTHWKQQLLPDDAALSQFGHETVIDSPYQQVLNIEGKLPYADESNFSRMLRSDMAASPLSQSAHLEWAALHTTGNWDSYLLTSVWEIAKGADTSTLFTAPQVELIPSEQVFKLETISAGDGSAKVRCLHTRVAGGMDREEWYCLALHAPDTAFVVYVQAAAATVDEQRPVIGKLLGSLSIRDDSAAPSQ